MIKLLDYMMEVVIRITFLVFLYQAVYVVVGLFLKQKRFKASKKHKFAVLISARNESTVIANLIESIKAQNYDADLVDTFVIADNCTDNTAQIAKDAGAIVYERFNTHQCGKGHALNYLFSLIDRDYNIDSYDGYFIFDADNILEKDYIEQMNTVFDNGYRIVTSYRNSKNFGDNWISSGYGLWFLREARFVNNARMILGVSCAVSGTGFLIHKDIIRENSGWNCFLLTEDIQFSVDNILKGEKIGYCGDAIFYDEQPIRFKDSWNQRLRWSKGFYQVFFNYGGRLAKNAIFKLNFSCYDMFVTIMPGIMISLLLGAFNAIALVAYAVNVKVFTSTILSLWGFALLSTYSSFFALGLVTTITEWKRIYCKPFKKIFYLFTFPFFMLTYLPISIVALFAKIHWSPIPHSIATTAREIREQP